MAGIDDTERALPVLEFAFDAGYVPVQGADDEEVRRLVAEASAGLCEKYPDVPVHVVVAHRAAEQARCPVVVPNRR